MRSAASPLIGNPVFRGPLSHSGRAAGPVRDLHEHFEITMQWGKRRQRHSARVQAHDPDLTVQELRPDDRILLCSDGLSSAVSAELIRNALCSSNDLEEVADRLIHWPRTMAALTTSP